MKNIFYEKPVLSSVLLNTTSCAIAINSINTDKYVLLSPLIITYFFNKRILLKGEKLSKMKVMFLSFFYLFTLLSILICNKYILNIIL